MSLMLSLLFLIIMFNLFQAIKDSCCFANSFLIQPDTEHSRSVTPDSKVIFSAAGINTFMMISSC